MKADGTVKVLLSGFQGRRMCGIEMMLSGKKDATV